MNVLNNPWANAAHEHNKATNDEKLNSIFAAKPYRYKFKKLYKSTGVLSGIFHGLSVLLAVFGAVMVLSMMFGYDLNLAKIAHNGKTKDFVILGLIFGGSALMLVFMEFTKSSSIISYYRDKKALKEKADKSGFKLGIIFSIVNVVFSLIGAYVLVSTVLGSRGMDAMAAVEAEHAPIVAQLEKEVADATSDGYRNRQGKILYKHLPVVKAKNEALDAARVAFASAKSQVSDEYGTTANSQINNDQQITFVGAMMVAAIFIELMIFFLVKWRCNYEYKSFIEISMEQNGTISGAGATQPPPIIDLTKEPTPPEGEPRQPISFGKNPLILNQIKVPTKYGTTSEPPSKVKQMIGLALKANNFEKAKELMKRLEEFNELSSNRS